MLSFDSETSLPRSCTESYCGLAFDGCRYYLPVRCAQAVAVLDRELCLERRAAVCRPYTAICYDPQRTCFWAVSHAALFRLDRDLQETDRLALRSGGCLPPITSVSFCCNCGLLMLSAGNRLLTVDPADGSVRPLLEEPDHAVILTAACLPPYVAYTVLRGSAVKLVLADPRSGNVLAKLRAPTPVNAILPLPCRDGMDLLLLTGKRGCYPCLLRERLDCTLVNCLCPCNWDLLSACCGEGQASGCTGVLTSIALQETAIAHILDAESCKLRKVLEGSPTPCELLQVNRSVQRTILYATQLEQSLVGKLDALRDLCGPCLCGGQAPSPPTLS